MRQRSGNHRVFWSLDAVCGRRGHCQLRMVRAVDRAAGETGDPRHPKKLRVIAETKNKTDRIDAHVLAEFLALDMIPQSYRPTPRLEPIVAWCVTGILCVAGRLPGRARTGIYSAITTWIGRTSSPPRARNTCRASRFLRPTAGIGAVRVAVAAASQPGASGQQATAGVFQESAVGRREHREVLRSIPMIGSVTLDVVLSELGDVRRFHSQKKAVAYAGLDPGVRASADRRKELHITKEGSRLLRWALVEAAWRLVVKSRYWGFRYERLKARIGAKKAIWRQHGGCCASWWRCFKADSGIACRRREVNFQGFFQHNPGEIAAYKIKPKPVDVTT